MASNLRLYDTGANTTKIIAEFAGNDAIPMWYGDAIYFLSDRGQKNKVNIWAYDIDTEDIRQVTEFADYDIKWASLGPEDIVFENGGKIYLLPLKDKKVREISINVPDDLPEIRPRIKDLSKNINSYSVSPSGKRALFEARGEVVTVPANNGGIRNITKSSGYAERFPSWSPDGKSISYFSDRSGEYELYVRRSDGKGEESRLTKDGKVFRYHPVWAPDSKKIAYSDKTGALYFIDTVKKKPVFIDKNDHGLIDYYSWSPDSRWVAYAKHMPNSLKSVFIYDTKQGKSNKITSEFYNDNSPVFDPSGKYLYFYSDRKFEPAYGDMDESWIYPDSTQVYALTLRSDAPSPLAHKIDEEYVPQTEQNDDKKKDDKSVEIDFENIELRAVKIPVNAGNFGRLNAVEGKIVYMRYPNSRAFHHNGRKGQLQYFDLNERAQKMVIGGIDNYALSSNGSKVIYKSGDRYGIIDLGEGMKVGQGEVNISKMKSFIDPRREWSGLFNDSWRIMRDYFYDPNMHGMDWDAVKSRYEKLLPYVVSREDLNYVIGEMVGELNSSHTYVKGGDIQEPENVTVGLLGADFKLDSKKNLFQISKIYNGGEWNSDIYSPLTHPGVGVSEGDYLISVNGVKLDTSKDPWQAFQGLEGEVVTLTVSSPLNYKEQREIVVKLISRQDDLQLRYLDWVENNRLKVDKATGGRVGYVYVPDTGWYGQNELVRQFTPQHNKHALIIDERFNGGGQVPDRFIELLNRPLLNYWAMRDYKDWHSPTVAHSGPKVMLINGWAGSGGDAFPYYFRKAGLGPLVGTRTLGGLIGIGGSPELIDGGWVSAPVYAFWNLDGQWDVEGTGVEPDYKVEDIAENLNDSTDPQLDKAIKVILELLEKNPPVEPRRPQYEDRSGTIVN